MKCFYFDVETTGLSPVRNDIIQLACIVEVDKVVQAERHFQLAPPRTGEIEMRALEIQGLSLEKVKTWDSPETFFTKFLAFLDTFISKYDREDKFQVIGYNVRFDMDFLESFFRKRSHKFFGSYFDRRAIDVMTLVSCLRYCDILRTPNAKLEENAKALGITITAHDPLSDIRATREIFNKVNSLLLQHTTWQHKNLY